MIIRPLRSALIGAAMLAAVAPVPAVAQRQQASPEQRIDRLEKQLQQMQRTVFPKGRPADTAGFADEPAATQSAVSTLAQRLESLERQMSDLLRQIEENGNSARQIENGLSQLRAEQEQRIAELERKIAAAAAAPVPQPVVIDPEPPAKAPPKAKAKAPAAAKGNAPPAAKPVKPTESPIVEPPAADPAEMAYTQGFKLWEAKQYDAAIAALREFTAAYPNHRRTSYANNLIGRAHLDKGDAQAAVQAFVANYEGNPAGERAADSLYYLGQALVGLGRPAQACNAFSELDKIYGDTMRADLKKLATEAKSAAGCNP